MTLSIGLPTTQNLRAAAITAMATTQPISVDAAAVDRQGANHYQAGDYAAAAAAWEQAIPLYRTASDWQSLVRTLSNLSLAQQQLEQWSDALVSIEQSLSVLQTHDATKSVPSLWAQVLNAQGNLRFGLGQMEGAVAAWEAATTAYETAGSDLDVILQSQLNLALALKSAGFYPRAQEQLAAVLNRLRSQPDSALKATALQRSGDVLRLVGDLDGAEAALTASLDIAQTLKNNTAMAAVLLSWGNTKRVRGDIEAAQEFYRQVIDLQAGPAVDRVLAQLALLSLMVQQQQWSDAQTLWPTLAADLQRQPISHQGIYNRINLAQSLIQLQQGASNQAVSPAWKTIASLLSETAEQAQHLDDRLSQSYAIGYLGSVYEQTRQWSTAQTLTEQALNLAQMLNAEEALYLWQWQLGRLLRVQGDIEGAISAYGEAVQSLQALRSDLATVRADLQFSFRDNVEPVYREFVGLLLQSEPGQEPSADKLAQAREVIESLQLAELDNYFQAACLQGKPVSIDQLDAKSAVLYPIILADRLELILSLPQGQFRHYSRPVPEAALEALIAKFRRNVVILSRRNFLAPSRQLYDLLVRPALSDLRANGIETLVFVLDGSLKSIPMAALHNGQQYLIEEFGVALSPGLQLISPKPLQPQKLEVLAAGLSEGRQGFAPLSYVTAEIEKIRAVLPKGLSLIDASFTKSALQDQVNNTNFPIVHIATHGRFSSDLDSTFLVAWDDLIQVNELNRLLQDNTLNRQQAIELLVLSACQTATGDQRAALGLAGFAIKAGARSTLASLWSVNDAATSELMAAFYSALTEPGATRAGALRQAQLAILADPEFEHPLYWAAFVLLGSWL